MRHTACVAVALLLIASPLIAGRPSHHAQAAKPVAQISDDEAARLLGSARTIWIVTPGVTSAQLRSEIQKKLLAWGRLSLVSPPEEADLILEVRALDPVQAYSEYRATEGGGVRHTATLEHRESGVQIWSTTKGGTWPMSDWSGAWAGRAIADELVKHFDKTVAQKDR